MSDQADAASLLKLADSLAAGTSIDAFLETLGRRLVDVVGDMAIIALLTDDGSAVLPVAVNLGNDALQRAYRAALEESPARSGEGNAGHVIATNRALVVAELDPESVVASARAEWRAVVRRLNVCSLVIVPMRARGIPIGAVTLIRNRPGAPYRDSQCVLVQDVADRAATSIALRWVEERTRAE